MGISPRPEDIEATAAADMQAIGERQAGNVVATCPKVTLEIGVFFDGTGNNEANAQIGGGEGSFGNARSNVSLLGDLYYAEGENDVPNECGTGYLTRYDVLYVPGIGTVDGDTPRDRESEYTVMRYLREAGKLVNIVPDGDDDLYGMAMGVGPRGIEARVIRAALDVGQIINKLSPTAEPKEVVLDVFGFSRGAAAARHFVNAFNQGYLDYEPLLMRNVHARLPEGRNIRIRFVGVFDTVAAIGADANDANNWDVNVHLSETSADTIFHLTAKDEIRHSFSLNRNAPDGGQTMQLPGVHSNVGGGYTADFTERPVVIPPDTGVALLRTGAVSEQAAQVASRQASVNSDAATWVSEGWVYNSDLPQAWEIEAEPVSAVRVPTITGMVTVYYTWKVNCRLNRPWIRHELSRSALKMMYDKATSCGVPLRDYPEHGEYVIPGDMMQASMAEIKRTFTHHSANYNDVYAFIGSPMREAANRRRREHPNQPGLAK